MTSDKISAHWIIDAAQQMGVETFVFSPGSRNAPLIIAAADRPELCLRTVLDERSAAFQALGASLRSGRPVAICCTSGSALSNYYPAVLEAYYSKVPLVIITADRPSDRINKGEGQTCVQPGIFEPHVGWSIHLNEDMPAELLQRELAMAAKQLSDKQEPVHINIAFDEPLYGQVPEQTSLPALDWSVSEKAVEHDFSADFEALQKGDVALIVGQLTPEKAHALKEVLSQNPFAFFADPTSGLLHLPEALPMSELLHHQPKVVISVGGQWVDKRPKQHLRSIGVRKHIHVDPFEAWEVLDAPFEHVALEMEAVAQFLPWATLFAGGQKPEVRDKAELDWSDARAFAEVVANIAPEDVLHLGNSTTVRYANFFPPQAKVHSNRGVAGIDGSLSTAVGAALAEPSRKHWCILGDQSFLYDSNALHLNELPANLCVVVLNNSRGAIFDWLPGTAAVSERGQNIFANPLEMDLGKLVEACGGSHIRVSNETELVQALESSQIGFSVIEAYTALAPNTAVYKSL